MTHEDICWKAFKGRDSDGDLYDDVCMIHGSGRILARVVCPGLGEYRFHLYFYCKLPAGQTDDCLNFVDVESAKKYAIELLIENDPFVRTEETRTKDL